MAGLIDPYRHQDHVLDKAQQMPPRELLAQHRPPIRIAAVNPEHDGTYDHRQQSEEDPKMQVTTLGIDLAKNWLEHSS